MVQFLALVASPLWSTGSRAQGFSGCGPRALEHRLSLSVPCKVLPDQGSNPGLLP